MNWSVWPIGLAVLGVIVVIHELGHFLVAKLFKIRIETFSVGFGPRLLGFRYGDTDYRISAIPLGGYVKMSGENVGDTVTGASYEFMSKPKWQRFLVAAAGPAMNIILAVGLLTGLFMYGMPVPEYTEGVAVVGAVASGSPAESAGIKAGDRFISIADKEQPKWEEVHARVVTNAGQTIPVVLDRGGQRIETSLSPTKDKDAMGDAGIFPNVRVIVMEVMAGTPAETAGIKAGDELLTVNGTDVKLVENGVADVIKKTQGAAFPLTLLRDGEVKELSLTTVLDKSTNAWKIGIRFDQPSVIVKEDLSTAFARSVDKNIEYGTLIFQVLKKLVTRQMDMKAVDGPIGIIRATGSVAQFSLTGLVMLVAMISLNLGLMNLLPIPILDGGVMLLLVIESVMGEISIGIKERIVQVSFVFLLTLMVFVVYNDIIKSLPSSTGP